MIDERRNEDRGLKVPDDYVHGDHGPLTAVVEFRDSLRFNNGRGLSGSTAHVIIRCGKCCGSARANHFKSTNPTEPNAFFRETVISKVLLQAFNNFRSKAPASCADTLAAFILTS